MPLHNGAGNLVKPTKPVLVVVRRDQDRTLDRIAKQAGKTRSSIVQDALDRLFTPIPDVENPRDIYDRK